METTVAKGRQRAVAAVLAVSNVASLLTALNVVSDLRPEDKITIKRGCALTLLGLVYFTTLFELLNTLALSSSLRHKYRLSCGDVLDVNNKLVSAVQALFCCVTGAVVLGWSCARDVVHASHFVSEGYAWFGAAYFFYDIWSMYMVHVNMVLGDVKDKSRKPKNGALAAAPAKLSPTFFQYCKHEPVILFHHLFIGGFGFLVIVYLRGGLGDCVFGFVYLMELSTPFVSFRGILSRLKLKATRAYVLNGVLMLLTFLFCRVLSLPYVCYMYSKVIGLSYFETIQSLPTGCKVSIFILLLPQLYWFYLMSAGAVKVFRGPQEKRS
ncbi:hypothetical protein MSG28_005543 [Choristoneura fumiferana]|uniref:Uncharacterized protein n=1 Tax=Choristoneura fumiferana TaxID=7141 RepID=A0ACC0KZ80_CHOFU|nr:hypothetical protein MSG28_005543 [Choristoneura fumiferana]